MATQAGIPNTNGCPGRRQLSAYTDGTLPRDAIHHIAAHLEVCAGCLQTLQNLEEPNDSLIKALAGMRPTVPSRSAEDERIVATLAGMCFGTRHAARGPALTHPRQIGPYEILEQLGEGGMGAVYKARHVHLGKVVALKLLPVERGTDGKSIARFMQEMKAAGLLSHPNIVQAHDAGVESVPYLAMEFLEGMDLDRLVRERGPMPVAEACECVRQAAAALQHAFSTGLVHRDVKPSNLLLTPDGCVKLLDLGLARLGADVPRGEDQSTGDGTITSAGAVMGTIDYISPEQLRDSRSVDIRADLYSLGCTLYHLLTGGPPFGRAWEGSLAKQIAHLQAPAPDVRVVRPDVPQDLGIILDRLLAKNPDYRFVTPAEVGTALEPFTAGYSLRGLTGRGSSSGVGGVPPVAEEPFLPPTLPTPSWHKPSAGHPQWHAWTSVALVFLLAVALGLALMAMRPDGDDDLTGEPTNPAGTSLAVESLHVDQFRKDKRGVLNLGPVGTSETVRRGQDSIRLSARVSEAAHLYLIGYRPDGKEVLCWPEGDEDTAPAHQLAYPAEGPIPLNEPGTHAFVLVASRTPLPPFDRWGTGPVAWPEPAPKGPGAWKFDGRQVSTLTNDPSSQAPPAFKELCRVLAARPGVDAVQAVAFRVQPE